MSECLWQSLLVKFYELLLLKNTIIIKTAIQHTIERETQYHEKATSKKQVHSQSTVHRYWNFAADCFSKGNTPLSQVENWAKQLLLTMFHVHILGVVSSCLTDQQQFLVTKQSLIILLLLHDNPL